MTRSETQAQIDDLIARGVARWVPADKKLLAELAEDGYVHEDGKRVLAYVRPAERLEPADPEIAAEG